MSENIKLLIVDDEVQFLESIAKRLELRGFDVEKAKNGDEAIEAARHGRFDLALVDLRMPGMDGQEVLEILKAEHKYLEVIILTGHGSIDSAVECTKLGAFGYLSKPYELEHLLEVLKEAYAARLKKKFADDQARLARIEEAEQLTPEDLIRKTREQMREHPSSLSILRALFKIDDDEK
jgi:DNA-binding NtrC family response regulator